MPLPTENPYAPSAVDASPAPPEKRQWHVAEGTLMVSDGAVLPDVDLRGTTGAALFRIERPFRLRTPWLSSFGLIPALCQLIGYAVNAGREAHLWIVRIGTVVLIPSIFLMNRAQGVKVKSSYCLSARLMARRRRVKWICILILTISGVVWSNASFEHNFPTSMAALIASLAALLVMIHAIAPPIRCSKAADGWFRLTGVHAAALRELELISIRKNEDGR